MKRWKIIIPAFLAVASIPLAAAFLTPVGSAAGQEAAAQHDHDHGEETGERTLQITVWDDLFEVFIEHPPLVAGEAGRFLTHLTELDGFDARGSGPVVFVISSGEMTRRYSVDGPARAGIYSPDLIFPEPGAWDLSLIIGEGDGEHLMEITNLRVYSSSHDILHAAMPENPEGIGFLKEQQWKMDFDTEIVSRDGSGPGKRILINEAALVREGEKEVVFVQLGGETFGKRGLELGARENGKVEVISGLAEGERIVTIGAWAVADAEYAPSGDHDHLHAEENEVVEHDHGTEPAEESGHDHGLDAAEESGHDHGLAEVEESGHDHGEEADADGHAGEGVEGETGEVHTEDEGQIVHMTEENMKKFGIELEKAGPGIFDIPRKAQGEIVLNADRTAHIVPRVSGITVEVSGDLGDKVEKGDLLAVIESPDLADSKADYLASVERLELARAVFQREERLRAEGISSESEFLDAKRGFAEARIEQRSAQQKLLALGIRGKDLAGLSSAPAEEFARYEVRAPLAGTVIKKHIATGETVAADSDIFLISCLDTVWADLRIYQSDVGLIRAGQEVVISKNQGTPLFSGEITYVDPVIDSTTRTAMARVELDNSSGVFNPGTFISAEIISEKRAAALVVKRSTIQEVGGELCVFVWDGHGFVLRPVLLGHTSGQYAEIVSGLSAGEIIAATNSFRLKAELTTSENASCSAHGHAH